MSIERVFVAGAGLMGHGIAMVHAGIGKQVTLYEPDLNRAMAGRDRIARNFDRWIEKGILDEATRDTTMARIRPTNRLVDVAEADLVIEAVFEDPAVKAQVFAEIEPHLAPDALLGSNTSTLPITGLAEGVSRPADFIGLHFFSPVDKMPLLEIIKGEKLSLIHI